MRYFYKTNDYLEQKISDYFSSIEEVNQQEFDGQLSVLLLGSLSRGEASWYQKESEEAVLVSDIEFFTIYPKGFFKFNEFTQLLERSAERVFGTRNSTLFHIDNTFVCKDMLPKLEKKLLIFDAVAYGRCVVGEDVTKMLPDVNISNINLYDIRDILVHRVFSVLYYGLQLKDTEHEPEYRYLLAKNSLDLMTVLLVNKGILVSGFLNRLREIEKVDIDEDLKKYFSYCLSVKFSVPSRDKYSIEEMESTFIKLVKELQKEFHVLKRNSIVNVKAILRRRLGILKRAVKYRHLVMSQEKHLRMLIATFEKRENLTKQELKNNLILNGYPLNI